MSHGDIYPDLSVGCKIEILNPDSNEAYYGAGDVGEVIGWDSLSVLVRFEPSDTVSPGHPPEVEALFDGPYDGVWWVAPTRWVMKVIKEAA